MTRRLVLAALRQRVNVPAVALLYLAGSASTGWGTLSFAMFAVAAIIVQVEWGAGNA